MPRLTPVVIATHVIAALILTMGAPTHAVPIMINNGLAPPNSENVIDGADDYSDDDVYVRNVGCPPGWPAVFPYDPCPSPGAATEVEVVSGGTVGDDLSAYDSSTVTMSDGTVAWDLSAYDSSTVTMSGGTVAWDLSAYDSSTVTMRRGSVGYDLRAYHSSTATMSGGSVGGLLRAHDAATVTIVGRGFEVDGSPAPYGDLTAQTGTLTGTLASGDPINNVFHQGGGSYTGTITLAPPGNIRVPALSLGGKLALAGVLVGSVVIGRRRAL